MPPAPLGIRCASGPQPPCQLGRGLKDPVVPNDRSGPHAGSRRLRVGDRPRDLRPGECGGSQADDGQEERESPVQAGQLQGHANHSRTCDVIFKRRKGAEPLGRFLPARLIQTHSRGNSPHCAANGRRLLGRLPHRREERQDSPLAGGSERVGSPRSPARSFSLWRETRLAGARNEHADDDSEEDGRGRPARPEMVPHKWTEARGDGLSPRPNPRPV